MTKIHEKESKKGNYMVEEMAPKVVAAMGPQDIKNTAALIIEKSKPNVIKTISVRNLSILAQAMCLLPEIKVSEVSTVIRYVNLLPNGQLVISYFGAMPSQEIIDALTKLAYTANNMNGGIFSGYAALTPAMGEEKHFSPTFVVPNGITNIRVVGKDEIVFAIGKELKKMTLSNIAANRWDKAMEVGSFSEPVLFLDRVQNGLTNVVTKGQIVRGYSITHKKAAETLIQNSKLRVLSVVQWARTAVITTPFGLTQEPAVSYAA